MESKLQKIRNAAHLSTAELAKRSGVNERMIQYYENGYKDINKAQAITVLKIADALGCEVKDLLKEG